jgi:hypothetical protein
VTSIFHDEHKDNLRAVLCYNVGRKIVVTVIRPLHSGKKEK